MPKRVWKILVVFAITIAALPAQETAIHSRIDIGFDKQHTEWIDGVMRSIAKIKPGMTRKDLSKVFRTEGGLSTRIHRKYIYNHCPYIKVDVEFSAADESGVDPSVESPDDRIVGISRPYLEYTIAD